MHCVTAVWTAWSGLQKWTLAQETDLQAGGQKILGDGRFPPALRQLRSDTPKYQSDYLRAQALNSVNEATAPSSNLAFSQPHSPGSCDSSVAQRHLKR